MNIISKDSVILKQQKNIQKIDLNTIILSASKKHEKEILDIHRDQLRKGEKGDGKMPKYPAGYLNYKESLPSYFASPYTDLFNTGDFQKAEFIRWGQTWEIDSSDSKTAKLLDRYGDQIFELNPNSLTLVQEVCNNDILSSYHKELNK